MRLISAECMAQHWTLKPYTTCCQKSDHTLPLSQLMLGEGLFLLFGVFAWSSAAVAAARWFCANTVWITLTARRMSAAMGYRCNRT